LDLPRPLRIRGTQCKRWAKRGNRVFEKGKKTDGCGNWFCRRRQRSDADVRRANRQERNTERAAREA
jgi:hypothetical protein